MAQILVWPDPVLKTVSKPVDLTKVQEHAALIKEMFATLYDSGGVGLSAIQIGEPSRIFVMDVKDPLVFINPEIVEFSPGQSLVSEGCLSVPGVFEKVERYNSVKVRFYDSDGKEHLDWFSGLAAQCIQHETEHLDGMIFVEHLSPLKREQIRKRMKK